MMEGLLECQRRMERTPVEPVVQAAVIAFGFVLVHPFEDGNGRIHRLLIHYVLSRNAFTPKGIRRPRRVPAYGAAKLAEDPRLPHGKTARHVTVSEAYWRAVTVSAGC